MMYLFRVITAVFWIKEVFKCRSYDVLSKVSAIVPFYNETFNNLLHTVDSLIECGVDEIILVDDGSKNDTFEKIQAVKFGNEVRIMFIKTPENKGKKNAELEGLKSVSGEYVVLCDSDTRFDSRFIGRALRLFDNKANVGAVVGDIRIRNNTGINYLMDMVYFNAFNLWRASLSLFSSVPVCSGAASMYRKEVLDEIAEEYRAYKYNTGQDRYMTYLTLKCGYKTLYSPFSTAHTESPTGMKLLKQQIRWEKSFWRAFIYSFNLPRNFGNIYLMVDMVAKAVGRLIYVMLFVAIIKYAIDLNYVAILWIFIWLALYGLVTSLYAVMLTKKLKYFNLVWWQFISLFFSPFIVIYSLATIKSDKWLTR